MKVYAVRVLDIDREEIDKLCLLISLENKNRIERFVSKKDKIRTLVGELLIRKIVKERLGIGNEAITIGKNQYGKPYLENDPSLHFNVSHSGDYVVCAFDEKPVGVDIEQIEYIEDYKEIAERYFTKIEIDHVTKSDDYSLSRFYEIWTAKESYIKCNGKGLSIPLKSFSIEIIHGNIRAVIDKEGSEFAFEQFAIDPDYILTVCSMGCLIASDVISICQKEL